MTIEELVEKIKENRYENDEAVLTYSDELRSLAQKEGDTHYMGVALYYKGECYYGINEDSAVGVLEEALEYLAKDYDIELSARAHNLIGIISSHKEDYSAAINHFNAAITICSENNLPYAAGLVASNMGFLFQSIENYYKAIESYEDAVVFFHSDVDNPNNSINVSALKTNIFSCLYFVQDIEKMEDVLQDITEAEDLIEPTFLIPLFKAVLCKAKGKEDKIEEYIDDVIRRCPNEEDIPDCLDNYQFLCRFLFDNNYMDELGVVLKTVDECIPHDIFPRIRIEFVKYKMHYCEMTGDNEGFREAAKEHVALYERITGTYHKTVDESLLLQLYVKKLKDDEVFYKKAAGTDTLTKLYNRSGIAEVVKPMLNDANERNKNVATFIMDIDYFKQYNDHYGHVLGDDCLRKVADVIRRLCVSDCYACRYGGDEFIIVCNDMEQELATDFANEIVESVRGLQIESVDSPIADFVTVSIGIYVGVPEVNEDLRELIGKADIALYKVKEKGRNGFFINVD